MIDVYWNYISIMETTLMQMMFQCLDWCFWWIIMDHGATFVSAFASSQTSEVLCTKGSWTTTPLTACEIRGCWSFLQFSGCHLTEFGTLKSFKIPQFYARCSPTLHHIYGKLGFFGMPFSMIFYDFLISFPISGPFFPLESRIQHSSCSSPPPRRCLGRQAAAVFPFWNVNQKGDPPIAGCVFFMENPWKIGWWGFRFVMGVPQNWWLFSWKFHKNPNI